MYRTSTLVIAAAVLLVVEACTAAAASPEPTAVPPTASLTVSPAIDSPSPEASSPTPEVSAEASPTVIGVTRVAGSRPPMTVTLLGDPEVLTTIRAATELELTKASGFGPNDLTAAALNEHSLVVAWLGTVCDVSASLTVEPASIVLAEDPRRGCDAMGVGKGVVVRFADPVDATSRKLVFIRGPLLE
jgi:hypothetical protein